MSCSSSRRQVAGPGQRTLDHVLRHGASPYVLVVSYLEYVVSHTPGTDYAYSGYGCQGQSRRTAAWRRGTATREALLAAAREPVRDRRATPTRRPTTSWREAGVTKGALYHHFAGKEAIFRAVVERVQQDASDRAVAEFLGPDSWVRRSGRGCGLWIDAHLDPAVQRILMQDARAVLGWEEARAIENRFAVVALRGALRKAMTAGVDPARCRCGRCRSC